MSADLASPASAPSRPQTSRSDMGVSDKDFTEPWSVYTVRRKASGQKRSKDASSSTSAAARIRLDLSSSSGKKTRQASENKKKTLKVAPKKVNSGKLWLFTYQNCNNSMLLSSFCEKVVNTLIYWFYGSSKVYISALYVSTLIVHNVLLPHV
jgi:hypothetical protein